jgi:hypothetical protein
MDLPFSERDFLEVFRRYNELIWPLQVGFYALGVLLIVLARRGSARSSRWSAGLLALLWGWMGAVYHLRFFASINPAARLFGGIFLLQAAALLYAGLSGRLSFRPRKDPHGLVGWTLIAYALIAYPIVGVMAGHAYPGGATFGLPCPTTIFTFGLLLWSDRRVPLWIVAIPAAWSIVGVSAAVQLSIPEDYGLPVAAVVAVSLIVEKNLRLRKVSGSPVAMPA